MSTFSEQVWALSRERHHKLMESAQARWRAVNAPHLVARVRAGAQFEKGTLVERSPDERLAEPDGAAA